MRSEHFAALLRKYIHDECTPKELRQIDRWYSTLGKNVESTLTSEERAQLKAKNWARIEQQCRPGESTPMPKTATGRVISWGLRIAASLLLVTVVGWLVYSRYGSVTPSERLVVFRNDLESRTNKTNDFQRIQLPDQSWVKLAPGSRIRYNPSFATTQREVWLDGDAFFQVRKDSARPFTVYSGTIMTRVLGTSFWIRTSPQTHNKEVSVRTGKVSVAALKTIALPGTEYTTGQSLILTPNEMATFIAASNRWETGLANNPQPVLPANAAEPLMFRFDSTPLTDIAAQLQRAYGIRVELENEVLKNCQFTGDISQPALFRKLDMICQAINATYEVRGTHIVISGPGCNPLESQ